MYRMCGVCGVWAMCTNWAFCKLERTAQLPWLMPRPRSRPIQTGKSVSQNWKLRCSPAFAKASARELSLSYFPHVDNPWYIFFYIYIMPRKAYIQSTRNQQQARTQPPTYNFTFVFLRLSSLFLVWVFFPLLFFFFFPCCFFDLYLLCFFYYCWCVVVPSSSFLLLTWWDFPSIPIAEGGGHSGVNIWQNKTPLVFG